MKKIYTMLAGMAFTLTISAQGNQTATLLHNGTYKTYQNSYALYHALEDADHGDIITLSPGSFSSCDITKGVTIRGAGTQTLESQSPQPSPTIISGSYAINIPDSITTPLYMEGLDHTENPVTIDRAKNATFVKCTFSSLTPKQSNTSVFENISFIHCYFKTKFKQPDYWSSVNLYNSVLTDFEGPRSRNVTDGTASFYNCILDFKKDWKAFYRCYLENCIINHNTSYSSASITSADGNTCINTIFAGKHGPNAFGNMGADNHVLEDGAVPFINDTFYRVNDETKAYKGTDGKETGIYGGTHPFTQTTSYPRITKLNIAPESSTDGTLNIELIINTDRE